MRNYITFDGVDTREFELYVNGHGTFKSPERSYDMYEVRGRHGSISKDNRSLKNLELTYVGFIFTDFDKNFSNLKNFLLSRSGYCRLQDTYHPDEYRLAIFKNAIEPDMDQRNEVGMFELVFECQPQRYLLTGEVIDEMDVSDPPGETYTGDVVAFENPGDDVTFDLKAEIDPSFDGYDHVDAYVSGKNLCLPLKNETKRGLTLTKNADGTNTLTGAYTGASNNTLGNSDAFTLPAGEYIISGGVNTYYRVQIINTVDNTAIVYSAGADSLFTLAEATSVLARVYIRYATDMPAPGGAIIAPMIRLASDTDPTFEPYSGSSVSQSFPLTVHKGKVDIDSGILTDEANYISSYDPLSIPADFDEIIQTNTEVETASGEMASFDCELGEYPLKSLTAQITPVQDLHGYDHPWAPGGGKNLLPVLTAAGSTVSGIAWTNNNDGSWTADGTASANSYARSTKMFDLGVLPAGDYTASGFHADGSLSTAISLRIGSGSGSTAVGTRAGSITFTADGSTQYYLAILVLNGTTVTNETVFLQLEDGSASTAYAPYSNLCPISGWTGVEAVRTGANLYGGADMAEGFVAYVPGSTSNENNVVHFNRNSLADEMHPFADFNYKDETQYTFIFTLSWTGISSTLSVLRVFYTDGTYATIQMPADAPINTPVTIVVVSAEGMTVDRIKKVRTSGSFDLYCNDSGIFEGVLTAADFAPYQGDTYSANWQTEAGTVYDGEIELVSGDLSRKYKAVDMGELEYYKLNGYYYAILPDAVVRPETAQTVPDALCSCYKVVAPNRVSSQTTYNDFACTISASFDRVLLRDSRYSTAAELKAALFGQTFLYRLAEPQTYQLTPTQIATLLGQNNIWADTGDISVEYRDGDVQDFEDVTLSDDALLTGTKIIYPKDPPGTYSLTPATLQLIEGTNYIYANTGDVTVRVAEPFSITNPTYFDSRPLIRVYGTGTFHIGEYTIIISEANEYTDIDCSIMDCFKGSENRNPYVSFSNHEFPVLKPGENIITMGTGITKIEITPRWFRV